MRFPDRYWPGERTRRAEHLLERARDDDLAAVLPGARTDVDDVVGDPDRLFVVLDDDHRVPEVAQAHQRVDEPLVVALVQPDRRLVEHVQHADQPTADLRREPDALRLAAGQRGRRAVEREVVEADVEEEAQALVDLLLDRARRSCGRVRQLDGAEELRGLADRELTELVDVDPADGDRQRLRPQPRAVARGARHLAHVALDLLARAVALGILVWRRSSHGITPSNCVVYDRCRPYRLRYDTLTDVLPVPYSTAFLSFLRSFFHGVSTENAVLLGERLEHPLEVVTAEPRPRGDRAVAEREVVVGDDELGVDLEAGPEAVAALTRRTGS